MDSKSETFCSHISIVFGLLIALPFLSLLLFFSADQFCYTTNDGMLKISLGSMNNPYVVENQDSLTQCMINFPRMDIGNMSPTLTYLQKCQWTDMCFYFFQCKYFKILLTSTFNIIFAISFGVKFQLTWMETVGQILFAQQMMEVSWSGNQRIWTQETSMIQQIHGKINYLDSALSILNG